jgi:hypothetical protein
LAYSRFTDAELIARLTQYHGKPVTLITDQEPAPMETKPMDPFTVAIPMAEAIAQARQAQARQAKAAEPSAAPPKPAKPELWLGHALWRETRKRLETVERFATVSRLRESLRTAYGEIDEFRQAQKYHWHLAPC